MMLTKTLFYKKNHLHFCIPLNVCIFIKYSNANNKYNFYKEFFFMKDERTFIQDIFLDLFKYKNKGITL